TGSPASFSMSLGYTWSARRTVRCSNQAPVTASRGRAAAPRSSVLTCGNAMAASSWSAMRRSTGESRTRHDGLDSAKLGARDTREDRVEGARGAAPRAPMGCALQAVVVHLRLPRPLGVARLDRPARQGLA